MKKTLLLMGLGAFICSASVSAAPRKNSGKEPSKLAIAQKEANKINKRNAESKEIWRAGTETYFAFYEDGRRVPLTHALIIPTALSRKKSAQMNMAIPMARLMSMMIWAES